MFKLPNKVYDVLKWVVMIVIPALTTLYYSVAKIWGFEPIEPAKILASAEAVSTFLGVAIGISTANYNKETETKTE